MGRLMAVNHRQRNSDRIKTTESIDLVAQLRKVFKRRGSVSQGLLAQLDGSELREDNQSPAS